jgi:hypothetical protein
MNSMEDHDEDANDRVCIDRCSAAERLQRLEYAAD